MAAVYSFRRKRKWGVSCVELTTTAGLIFVFLRIHCQGWRKFYYKLSAYIVWVNKVGKERNVHLMMYRDGRSEADAGLIGSSPQGCGGEDPMDGLTAPQENPHQLGSGMFALK
ncbi:hypothetical protein [Agaribacterium haliotis]|uniref:hypothetical protein n=1 Tax=Agaribacterium haliotis TaxID=2013869 RepID=UPI001177E085|nr:hypothetical protein [Agaribacterium haliotis]